MIILFLKKYIYKKSSKYYNKENDWSKKDNENKWMYIELVKNYKYKKLYIGKSKKNMMTEDGKGYGKSFDGNSLLVNINKNNYVFIGMEIYEFRSDEIIKSYYSPVGNNDFPYPVAFSDNKTYFMLDKEYIENSKYPIKLNNKIKEIAYLYYYGMDEYKPLSENSYKMKSIKYIQKKNI